MSVKEDPIKLHKEAMALMDNGKFTEARDIFAKVSELYYKGQNYFGSAEMSYKAGECSFQLKEYQKGVEFFTKAADLSFAKGYERYGLSALEQARDCYKSLGGNEEKIEEINKKIAEIKKKEQEAESGEQSFSVFS